MSVQATSKQAPTGTSFRSLALAGGAAIIASIAANLITLVILKAVLDLPEDFPPLTPGPIIFFTTLGVLMASVVYAITARLSANPARTYTVIAIVALVVSCIPNVLLMMDPTRAPIPGGTSAAFGALIVFHVVAAAVAVAVLTRRAR